MNAFSRFPARLHWNAQQLADAVPLRLHALSLADVVADVIGGHAAPPPANRAVGASRRPSPYAACAALPRHFRIR